MSPGKHLLGLSLACALATGCQTDLGPTSSQPSVALQARLLADAPAPPVESVAVALLIGGGGIDTLVRPYRSGDTLSLPPVPHGSAWQVALVGFDTEESYRGPATGFVQKRIARWGSTAQGIADGTSGKQTVTLPLQIPDTVRATASGPFAGDSVVVSDNTWSASRAHPALEADPVSHAAPFAVDSPDTLYLARRELSTFVPAPLGSSWSSFAWVWSPAIRMVFASPTGRSTSGTFTDPRDGRLYRTTTFQGQTWMAENLSWAGSDGTLGSCVGGTPEGCSTWGRLYTWIEAMQGSTGSDATPSGVQGVCPSGWHLPSAAEWDSLAAHLGGGLLAGDSLKRSGAWTGGSLDGGRDAIGFDAIPSGRHDPDGADYYQGESAFWWTSSRNGTEAIRRDLLRDRSSLYQAATDISGSFAYSHSVRCVKTP